MTADINRSTSLGLPSWGLYPFDDGARQHVEVRAKEESLARAIAEIVIIGVDHCADLSRAAGIESTITSPRSLWPNRGEMDNRPILGSGYKRINRVKPIAPAVPESAAGALRYGSVSLGLSEGRTA